MRKRTHGTGRTVVLGQKRREREGDREKPTDGALPPAALRLSALPPSPQLPSQGNQSFLAAPSQSSLPLTVCRDMDPLALIPVVTRI